MINRDPVDRFTLAHVAFGFCLARLGFGFPSSAVVAILWELLERPLKRAYPGMFPHPSQDSTINATVDAAAVLVGWQLGRK